ncbi:MAG: molybdopterin synthase sulfur carrier subunit [Chloroflexota bacterium]
MPVVELYGRARLLAGVRSVRVPGETIGQALHSLARLHPELVGPVLDEAGGLTTAYALNLNGLRFCSDLAEPIRGDDQLLLISSLSGG